MKHLIIPAALLLATLNLAVAQDAPEATSAPMSEADSSAIKAQIAESRSPEDLTQLIAQTRMNKDVEIEMAALDRRIELRPHIGLYRLDKAFSLARDNKKSEAYTALIELQNSGYAYDIRDDKRFEKVNDTKIWGYITDNFDANRKPFGEVELAYTLPREDLLAESIAYDPGRNALLVGSARQGKVFVVKPDGKLETLVTADAENGLWAVLDLAVDAKHNVLWVASAAIPHFENYQPEKDLGRSGIFKFDLKTGKFLKHFLSPPAQDGQSFMLTSMALGAQGEVYAADGVNRAVYQVNGDAFRRLLHLPMLTSISAIATSFDGKKLYMADPQLGVIGVDLATLKPFDVRVPLKLSLEGIASLAWHDGALIVSQAGMNPQRVIRLGLNPEGNTITQVAPLVAGQPAFSHIGALALNGDRAYLVANDQKDNYDRFGLLKSKDKLESTRILSLSTTVASDDPTKVKLGN